MMQLHEIKRIVSVDPDSFSVIVQFEDGLISNISLRHIFTKPKGLASEVLRGGMFDKCFLESGALAWPNGLELCPNAMRMWTQLPTTA